MSKLCGYNSDSKIPVSPFAAPKMFDNEDVQKSFSFSFGALFTNDRAQDIKIGEQFYAFVLPSLL